MVVDKWPRPWLFVARTKRLKESRRSHVRRVWGKRPSRAVLRSRRFKFFLRGPLGAGGAYIQHLFLQKARC